MHLEPRIGFWQNPRGHNVTISVAIVGGGPAGLTLAAALDQQGGFEIAVYERAEDHFRAETYNPDRSYTIDVTGHGVRADRFIRITDRFDTRLIHFMGLRIAPTPGIVASRLASRRSLTKARVGRGAAVTSAAVCRPTCWSGMQIPWPSASERRRRSSIAGFTQRSGCTRHPYGRLMATILRDCPSTRVHPYRSLFSSTFTRTFMA